MPRPRILVVDDDAAHRRTVERVLDGPYEVETASGGGPALEAAAREKFDVAILDIRMPGMDGFTLMGELKTADPDLDVILMTGSASDADARLVRAIREKAFYFVQKPFHRDVLLSLVARCLDIRRLGRERAQQASHLAAELEAARRFQASMLPAAFVGTARFELVALYEPSLEMGGDFYDHALLPNGSLALLVTDVSGKGASAAMMTGMLKQAFHAAARDAYAPGTVGHRVFEACRLFPEDRFATAFAARLDPANGWLEYVCTAGHPPAYLRRRNGDLERLEVSAQMLHPAMDAFHFEQRVAEVGPGDLLFAYTDGLYESRRANSDEWFDFAGIERALAGCAGPAGEDVRRVREALRAFQAGRPCEDDLTMVAVRLL